LKEVRQAPVQHGHPNLDQQVGAATAPMHRLLLGPMLADEPVDPRFDRGGGDQRATTLRFIRACDAGARTGSKEPRGGVARRLNDG